MERKNGLVRFRNEAVAVLAIGIFAVMTGLMVQIGHPWLRLLLLPVMAFYLWKAPFFRAGIEGASRNRIFVGIILAVIILLSGARVFQIGKDRDGLVPEPDQTVFPFHDLQNILRTA